MKVKNIKKHKMGLILWVVQVIISIILFGSIVKMDILSTAYLVGFSLVLILLAVIPFVFNMMKRVHIVGKILSVLLSILFVVGILYANKTVVAIDTITATHQKVTRVSVIALKTSGATTLEDIKNEINGFGSLETKNQEDRNKIRTYLEDKLNEEVHIREYANCKELADALYSSEAKAILLDESYRSIIKSRYKNFDQQTVVIDQFELKENVDLGKVTKNLTDEPFVVFLTGIDTSGSVGKEMRSDVNMIATVNPKTKQILLTSVPRDYYVKTSVSGGAKDKLTHTGKYGVQCSVETLEKLFDIDINYYFRVNFSGFKDIIDALGGVTVHSDYTFAADWGPAFKKGDNHVNGKEALAFARQRHETFRGVPTGFKGGDFQRNKDQQYLVKAIINKAASPSILTNFMGIMDSVSKSLDTNIKANDVKGLLKMQIDEKPDWNIVMTNLDGQCGKEVTFSWPGKKLSVVYARQSQINASHTLMNEVMSGKTVTKEDYEKLVNDYARKDRK